MTLYFVVHELETGDHMDLFVWADTPEDAAKYWSDYYFGEEFASSTTVYTVPSAGLVGAVPWEVIHKTEVKV